MKEQGSNSSETLREYLSFFETLQPASLTEVDRYFASDVHFKDPFNDVVGHDALRKIFNHMFTTTESPKFSIDGWMCDGRMASIRWRFSCGLQELAIDFPGMSFVRFNDQGKVVEHIDYWDPAEGIYEKIPLLGGLMRYLRRRLAIMKSEQ